MLIKSSFKPAWWLSNSHLQTIYPSLLRKAPTPVIKRERFITEDGDFIDVDFCGQGKQPLVILLHGLTGSSQSGYIKGLQGSLLAQGFRTAALNFRGCSGEYNHSSRCYHSGETGDIDFLYRTLRAREPQIAMGAVGFSLGGNVLLKWLGEQGKGLQLFAAVAVSVPLVLSECASRLDSGFSKIYRASLLRELKDYVRLKQAHLESLGKTEEADILKAIGSLEDIKSFWQYDNRVIASLYDFANVEDYYRRSSSRQYLMDIQVPTLLIQAADDPFMTADVIPSVAELSPSISMEITKSGGHVGFVVGNNPFRARYWLDQRIPEYFLQHISAAVVN